MAIALRLAAPACGVAATLRSSERKGVVCRRIRSTASRAILSPPSSGTPHVSRSHLSRQTARSSSRNTRYIIAAASGDGEKEPENSGEKIEKTEELVKVLQGRGMDSKSAQEILRVWKEVGIENSDDLRKILTRRSQSALAVLAAQTLLDFLAFYICVTAGQAFSESGGLISLLGVVSYAFCGYYALQGFFSLVTIVSLAGSGAAYGADADAVLGAVRQLASKGTQLDVVAKAKQAINMVKIVQSLNQASNILKTQGGAKTGTLEKLSAYLTLSNAEKNYGFDPAKYNMSETDALDIAAKFARFDLNDDGKLEVTEMEKLFQATGMTVSEVETKAAIDLLDKRRSGFVEFDEFVEWYVNNVPEPAPTATPTPDQE